MAILTLLYKTLWSASTFVAWKISSFWFITRTECYVVYSQYLLHSLMYTALYVTYVSPLHLRIPVFLTPLLAHINIRDYSCSIRKDFDLNTNASLATCMEKRTCMVFMYRDCRKVPGNTL